MIPDAMPTLSYGAHVKNTGYACAMEYVSVIAGEEWSDHPRCTNRQIASVVILINDSLSDSERHLLIPLIPRLVGAVHSEFDYPHFVRDFHAWWRSAVKPYSCACPCGCSGETRAVWPDNPMVRINLLRDLLDWYDQYTGRTERTATDDDVVHAAHLIAR